MRNSLHHTGTEKVVALHVYLHLLTIKVYCVGIVPSVPATCIYYSPTNRHVSISSQTTNLEGNGYCNGSMLATRNAMYFLDHPTLGGSVDTCGISCY